MKLKIISFQDVIDLPLTLLFVMTSITFFPSISNFDKGNSIGLNIENMGNDNNRLLLSSKECYCDFSFLLTVT